MCKAGDWRPPAERGGGGSEVDGWGKELVPEAEDGERGGRAARAVVRSAPGGHPEVPALPSGLRWRPRLSV